MAQTDIETIEQLPIRTIDFSDPADKAQHDKMVSLVQYMIDLHKQLAALKTDHEKIAIQRHINAAYYQIDRPVYGLYRLTNEEVEIAEQVKTMSQSGIEFQWQKN